MLLRVWRIEGVRRGLYRGLSASLLRQSVFSSMRHGLFGVAMAHLALGSVSAAPPSIPMQVAVGSCSGAIGALLANPADLCLVRMQADGAELPHRRRNYRHVFDAIRRVIVEEGVARLWRGSAPTVTRAALVTASQLPMYYTSKRLLVHRCGWHTDAASTHVAAAVASSIAASLATCPVDVVKTRLLNTTPSSGTSTTSSVACVRAIARTEGLLGFYKGLIPTMARLAPHTIILWLVQERTLRLLASSSSS